ncbi:MAG: 50S ribosomal protein L24 [Candidatus Gastranaerophilales bacterium]|nr:50S ribosomal protein L24 [Candidatus Gastranaerophilales bacterium]
MAKNTNKKLHTKVGDRVIVVSGKDKGKEGNVKDVNPAKGTVLVDGVNVVTKAQKANPMAGVQGGLNKVAKPLDASKVMICCPSCNKATRVAHKEVEGKKVRVCKKCGETIDV